MAGKLCADPSCGPDGHDQGDHHDGKWNCLRPKCPCRSFARADKDGIISRLDPSVRAEEAPPTRPESWPCMACDHPEDAHEVRPGFAFRGRCKRKGCGCTDYFPDKS